ncbi:hypothetical protein DA83_02945 [Pseudomonas sp. 250J]|nr:hypothetical protein DA83_02945 [Pseudomonas sp. 250J]
MLIPASRNNFNRDVYFQATFVDIPLIQERPLTRLKAILKRPLRFIIYSYQHSSQPCKRHLDFQRTFTTFLYLYIQAAIVRIYREIIKIIINFDFNHLSFFTQCDSVQALPKAT